MRSGADLIGGSPPRVRYYYTFGTYTRTADKTRSNFYGPYPNHDLCRVPMHIIHRRVVCVRVAPRVTAFQLSLLRKCFSRVGSGRGRCYCYYRRHHNVIIFVSLYPLPARLTAPPERRIMDSQRIVVGAFRSLAATHVSNPVEKLIRVKITCKTKNPPEFIIINNDRYLSRHGFTKITYLNN